MAGYRRPARRPAARRLPKRNLFWARFTTLRTFTETNLATVLNPLAQFNEEYGANLFGFTVTRIRGHYTWATSDGTDVNTTYNLSFGIRPDESVDSSAGNADTDDEQLAKIPVNDPYSDWMYVRNNVASTLGTGSGDYSFAQQLRDNRVELDIRSQRRFSELRQNLYVIAGLNASPGVDVSAWIDLHILLKQP